MDDKKLISQAQKGSTKAFGKLYDAYSGKIFRYIKLKIHSPFLAEDILQDTFIKAWKALPKFQSMGGNFSAWLYKIAGNSINDYFRRLYRTPETLELTGDLEIASLESPMGQMILQTDIENVKRALGLLPTAYRQVLELRFIQDFSINETAEILNKSNLSVRLCQHRALKQLRQIIKEEYDPGYSKI